MLTHQDRASHFPNLSTMTYLNTAAESIPPRCVADAIQRYYDDKLCGMAGRDMHFAMFEQCREIAASMIGLKSHEVSFCSCSSEAYNLLSSALDLNADQEVVISDLDFPAGTTPWLRASKTPRVRLWRSLATGCLELADLKDLLNNNTRLVQVSLVSFYNGFRLDWDGLVELVRSKAPQAILAVDVTQALGRVSFDCTAADFIVSSTHKWGLGIHGSCVVGVPERRWDELTTHAGGWFHIVNAFEPDRFVAAEPKPGVESFSVGMPNFVSIYALNASLRFLEGIGIAKIEKYSNNLTHSLSTELKGLGINLLAPFELRRPTGIVAFRHPKAEQIYEYLLRSGIHVMYHAGRLRISVHFYNTEDDLRKILNCLHDWFSKTE